MTYSLRLLQDGERTLQWNTDGDYPTLREAVREGERHVQNYDAFKFCVFNNSTKSLVWESVTPLALKAHP